MIEDPSLPRSRGSASDYHPPDGCTACSEEVFIRKAASAICILRNGPVRRFRDGSQVTWLQGFDWGRSQGVNQVVSLTLQRSPSRSPDRWRLWPAMLLDIADALRQQDEAIGSISRLLNALLDISKLEAGAIIPQPGIFPVSQLLGRLKREFRGIASGKGLELEVKTCDALVCTDPALLEQTLRNLVSNAIKYTHEGSVQLHAVETPPWIDIEVIDTGVGIAADQLQLIGEEFYQIGVPSNSTREGYGLGLSIVRRIIKLLALQLQVRSEAGRGSVFSVRLRTSVEAVGGPIESVT